MTRGKFDALTFWQQVQVVGTKGTCLAQRGEAGLLIELWHLPGGCLVEVLHRRHPARLVALRSLCGHQALEPYLAGITLPALGV